jgi:hypothetical protein
VSLFNISCEIEEEQNGTKSFLGCCWLVLYFSPFVGLGIAVVRRPGFVLVLGVGFAPM